MESQLVRELKILLASAKARGCCNETVELIEQAIANQSSHDEAEELKRVRGLIELEP